MWVDQSLYPGGSYHGVYGVAARLQEVQPCIGGEVIFGDDCSACAEDSGVDAAALRRAPMKCPTTH
jgi:hypothetical protein